MIPIQCTEVKLSITKKVKKTICLTLMFVTAVAAYSQGGKDLILTTDYQMIEANVILLGDARIQYKFEGEERINEMSVENIIKIKFADGKEHIFKRENTKKNTASNQAEELIIELPPYDKDLVAVIPFDFYDEKSGRSIGKKGLEVQRYIERKLTNQTAMNVLDSRETNARLMAAKVDYTNLEFYPISELSKFLGAGVIITGSVRYSFQEQVFANEFYVQNQPEIIVDESLEIDQHGDLNYVTDIYEVDTGGSWYIDFNQFETYETSTNLQIFEEGRKIYDKVRDPAFQWGSDDDWEGNIQWLLMKSPNRLQRND
jgi:hypothetical protein